MQNLIQEGNCFIIIDINANEKHFKIADRFLNSSLYSCELFVVNAAAYKKSDWQKIKIYTDMLEIRSRLMLRTDSYLQITDYVTAPSDFAACADSAPAA